MALSREGCAARPRRRSRLRDRFFARRSGLRRRDSRLSPLWANYECSFSACSMVRMTSSRGASVRATVTSTSPCAVAEAGAGRGGAIKLDGVARPTGVRTTGVGGEAGGGAGAAGIEAEAYGGDSGDGKSNQGDLACHGVWSSYANRSVPVSYASLLCRTPYASHSVLRAGMPEVGGSAFR